jgi:hypothetical protein
MTTMKTLCAAIVAVILCLAGLARRQRFICNHKVDNGMNTFTYLWGCGYAYGFRVPLLVVSEHTPVGTISGAVTSYPVTYPPPAEYTHDFGSILAFTENNFGLPPIAPQGNGYTF